jgi:hypothetical protein
MADGTPGPRALRAIALAASVAAILWTAANLLGVR